MYKRHVIGQKGEEFAKNYLQENNYKIIERNFNCRQGEIDIIAQDKENLVFIEVKTRTNKKYGEPIEAVTPVKTKHFLKSIQYYLYLNKLETSIIRIDIIEVYINKKQFNINHIKNAINL